MSDKRSGKKLRMRGLYFSDRSHDPAPQPPTGVQPTRGWGRGDAEARGRQA